MKQIQPSEPPIAPPPSKIAFVLGGGAALGAAQVGMLRALLERGIRPDLIVGTSIGAWNGLWLAAHPDLAEIDLLERIWRQISLFDVLGKFDMLGKNVIHLLMSLVNHRPYLVTDGGIRRILRRVYPKDDFANVTFDTLTIPLMVTATNIMRGRSETFATGPIAPALLASSAIPGLFPPVIIDGEQYVDGGLLDNGGISVAIEAGATRIYVLSVTYGGELVAPISSILEIIDRSFHLITSRHVTQAITQYADRAEFIVIEDEIVSKRSLLAFHHNGMLIDVGYRAALQAIDRHTAGQRSPETALAKERKP